MKRDRTGTMTASRLDAIKTPHDAKTEALYNEWLEATVPAEQTRLEREYRMNAFEVLPYIPLGRYRRPSAWRDTLRGIPKGPSIVIWNVSKT